MALTDPLTLKVRISVDQSWSTRAAQDIEVPVFVDPKLVGNLVADVIPTVVKAAQAEVERLVAAEASALALANAPAEVEGPMVEI